MITKKEEEALELMKLPLRLPSAVYNTNLPANCRYAVARGEIHRRIFDLEDRDSLLVKVGHILGGELIHPEEAPMYFKFGDRMALFSQKRAVIRRRQSPPVQSSLSFV